MGKVNELRKNQIPSILLFLFSGFLDLFDRRHQCFRWYGLYVGGYQEIITGNLLCNTHEHGQHHLMVFSPDGQFSDRAIDTQSFEGIYELLGIDLACLFKGFGYK